MMVFEITDIDFLHGWGRTPDNPGWYRSSGNQLAAGLGVAVHIPAMPNTDTPEPGAWVDRIEATVNSPDCRSNDPRNHLFICHSLGSQALNLWVHWRTLQAAENFAEFRVGGIIHAAANITDVGFAEITCFFNSPSSTNALKRCTDNTAIVYGNRDQYVPSRQAELLALALNPHSSTYGIPLLPLPQAHLSGPHEDIAACDNLPFMVELATLMIKTPEELKAQYARIWPFLGSAIRARRPREPYPYVEFQGGVLTAIDPNIEEHIRLGRKDASAITMQEPGEPEGD